MPLNPSSVVHFSTWHTLGARSVHHPHSLRSGDGRGLRQTATRARVVTVERRVFEELLRESGDRAPVPTQKIAVTSSMSASVRTSLADCILIAASRSARARFARYRLTIR